MAVLGAGSLFQKLIVCVSLVLINGLFVPAARAEEHGFVSAKVFYWGWNYRSFSRLSAVDVRRRAEIKMTIISKAELNAFRQWLDLGGMTSNLEDKVTDVRLVIDFYDRSGRRITYISNGARLMSEDGALSREVGDDFKRRFSFQH